MTERDDTPRTARLQALGPAVRQAREAAGKSIETCAELLGYSTGDYVEFETGETPLSLPELELLADYFDMPLTRLWEPADAEAAPAREPLPVEETDELLLVRQRIIGAQLRAARAAAGLSQPELAEAAGLPDGQLAQYELGETPVPLPELAALADALRLPLEHFRAEQGTIGEADAQRSAYDRFRRLSPEMREFVLEPMNESYLRLAMQLSALSVERLRGLAEGILDITY